MYIHYTLYTYICIYIYILYTYIVHRDVSIQMIIDAPTAPVVPTGRAAKTGNAVIPPSGSTARKLRPETLASVVTSVSSKDL